MKQNELKLNSSQGRIKPKQNRKIRFETLCFILTPHGQLYLVLNECVLKMVNGISIRLIYKKEEKKKKIRKTQ